MNTNSEITDPIADLQRRKRSLRTYLKDLTPVEKIRQLEEMQERYFEILHVREANGGLPIPPEWVRWHKAQEHVSDL
ncbi:MAG TPA: hypothetical protein PKD24_02525 [Pyrinomonadaceae bacterium]|nr:hypothetical protein [Pyrinomonadaceae bacterium]HMP63965.1 hypothetical protein [Pyrinomonadaceae bacterium]